MRVIWSKIPANSNYIIDVLSESTDWSPTTIKTFLARLVKKGFLSFEVKGRIYYYYPLKTEEECIRKEMQNIVSSVYGGILNKKTEHFLFYGSNISGYVGFLADTLESNFKRIAEHLQYHQRDKITVYIHPDLSRLHSALGILKGPHWLRAGWSWGILHIVPAEYFSDLAADRLAVHALAEIFIQKINPSAPFWLHQGIAAYESQWLDRSWIKRRISDQVKNNELTSLRVLSSDPIAFGDNNGHIYAYTAAEFIVEEYGYDKLNMLLRDPGSYSDIFGLSEAEFWDEWRNFINSNYMMEVNI